MVDSAPVDVPVPSFNEMAVLELIPVIIEQKRQGNVSPDEEETLKEIFGDLWIVIEEEVNRTEEEEMNPILKALLQSNESRLKRALVQHHQQKRHEVQQHHRQQYADDHASGLNVEEQNDIFGNTVDRVRVTRWPKSFVEVNPAELSPQQRLMRKAAFQIRQWFDQNGSKLSGTSSRGAARGGLKRNGGKNPARRRGQGGRRGGRRNNKGNNKNRLRRGENRRRKQQQNFRPKRHNTEIYVDDNHAAFDYEDFEDHSYDDMMSKPRSMRSSFRPVYDEFDSEEDDVQDLEDEYDE